ncbi:MAG: hypothetical protein K6G30_13820 [Acetatifactor sp.]|nr:hypothetical protein [Acetatifactor sp.]
MDTFMDKLAQKLTAQEMIKANSAADAEELNRLKAEVEGYKECLDKVQKLADEGVNRLENIQTNDESRKEFEAHVAETIAALKEDLNKELEAINDGTHKECVKVYRNVQAVLSEENKKQTESLTDEMDGINGKVSAAVVLSVVAMLCAAGGLAFQVLVYFHIL